MFAASHVLRSGTLPRLALRLSCATAVVCASSIASAQQAAPTQGPSTPADARQEVRECPKNHRLCWKYPRFRLWQFAQSAAATATGFALEYGLDFPSHGTHNDGILFDNPVRDALVAKSAQGRERARNVSDIMWPATQYFPLVEGIVVPLATDKFNYDVAIQLTLIEWQVTGIAFLLTRLPHKFVPRGRPSLSECSDNPTYDGACNDNATGRSASFFSGHTSMSFASAAVTCLNHKYLPLYGGNIADAFACGATMASAATVGVLRIVADKHWSTDVLTGAAVGLGVGFSVPYFLHYQYDLTRKVTGTHAALIPMATQSSIGASMLGHF